ncbi:MAG: hypothetical protein LBI39_02125 [Puniceicoccales bacterium]|nr:hypothetical protein [Puniceicoccales bacterium]
MNATLTPAAVTTLIVNQLQSLDPNSATPFLYRCADTFHPLPDSATCCWIVIHTRPNTLWRIIAHIYFIHCIHHGQAMLDRTFAAAMDAITALGIACETYIDCSNTKMIGASEIETITIGLLREKLDRRS